MPSKRPERRQWKDRLRSRVRRAKELGKQITTVKASGSVDRGGETVEGLHLSGAGEVNMLSDSNFSAAEDLQTIYAVNYSEEGGPNTFKYPAINLQTDEIRLIYLVPSDVAEDEIQCRLVTATLAPDLRYEALSYEWGPELPEHQILLNGFIFNVRENLWNALHSLRTKDEERIFWIDALCINQRNVDERNHQVAQMARIYSGCTRCIAWVGKEDMPGTDGIKEDTKLAVEFVHTRLPGHPVPDLLLGNDRKMHANFVLLCQRKYWSRLWILQEILLSSTVMVQCGPYEIPWSTLVHPFLSKTPTPVHLIFLRPVQLSVPFALASLSRSRQLHSRDRDDKVQDLFSLSYQFRDAKCADTRDTMFGLLGLTNDCCRQACPADYSFTAAEVFSNMMFHHIVCHFRASYTTIRIATGLYRRMNLQTQSTRLYKRKSDPSLATLDHPVEQVLLASPVFKFEDAIKNRSLPRENSPSTRRRGESTDPLFRAAVQVLDNLICNFFRQGLFSSMSEESLKKWQTWFVSLEMDLIARRAPKSELPPLYFFIGNLRTIGIATCVLNPGDSIFYPDMDDRDHFSINRCEFLRHSEEPPSSPPKGVSIDIHSARIPEFLSWMFLVDDPWYSTELVDVQDERLSEISEDSSTTSTMGLTLDALRERGINSRRFPRPNRGRAAVPTYVRDPKGWLPVQAA
ncbi:hypothetical protein GLAREA_04383 [Glarea lozoyensis ATCC 20868]|uniref:Heterokaryon incompatibility domain-containing protein n=1 Tax=Glarea lozoyensis (strain ATCC 20868 / MF5171) TaxID=1116229 RepID=S3CM49_GLAL2|nr:uncharacterized protein GLAREA_04383 [Glarea lozoyensis ATCC 20868]EPE27592.1 hypothetical protein GLAREA_04383 [Glarea lozoyensis ATCC 20868]